jgi:hypothetical protein
VLEFQEGNVDKHYRCNRQNLAAQEVVDAFRQYLAWNGHWRPALEFERVEIRPVTFRLGFSIGRLLGRVARLLRGK